jgi:8-oxo-dGTP pyrophosphatase MutT (NUDIX family)
VVERGGKQHIPRPPGLRPGGTPQWTRLTPEQRVFTVADVRAALAEAPPPRPPDIEPATSRPAAVLVALFEEAVDGTSEAHLILTKRPQTMPSHRGEIAFPGGKQDPGDPSLQAAALREAQEEIGLDPSSVELIGELDSISTVASQFTITPFVGVLPGPPALVPDPFEVDSVFAIPISELLDPETYREESWELWGAWRPMAFFDIPGETVWGATARILYRLLALLTASRS